MKIKYVSVSVSVSCLAVNANRLKLPRIQGGVNLFFFSPPGTLVICFFVGHRVPYTHIVAQSWELVRFGPKG